VPVQVEEAGAYPQPEPFLSLKLYDTTQCIRKECSRQAEKWTSVSPWEELYESTFVGFEAGANTRPLFSST
jgi:hypothetical protein